MRAAGKHPDKTEVIDGREFWVKGQNCRREGQEGRAGGKASRKLKANSAG